MPIKTIEWIEKKVRIVDQSKLPQKLEYMDCKDVETLREAISSLKVRGAPLIGIAAAFGVVLGIKDSSAQEYLSFQKEMDKIIDYLARSRPTAVNLFWSLKRMRDCAKKNEDKSIKEIKTILEKEALRIMEEDRQCNRRIGENGAPLIEDGETILTHCNAGALATADYGTALGIVYRAKEEGKTIKVYVDETRPLLQGARLTAWELLRQGIEVVLICDNMAGLMMQERKIDKVLVGADRVAANGDVANKIGTYMLAVLAKENGIPFYVACPSSSIDLSLSSGKAIPIEQRDSSEITTCLGKTIAPQGIKAYNPAFDVTPARYIKAIITEKGIHEPPYEKSLRK